MNTTPNTYQTLAQHKKAEKLHAQVLGARKKILGPEHPDTITSMYNLALMYQEQGKLKEAEEIYVLVTEMRKRLLGAEHLNTISRMNNLVNT